MKWMKLPGKVGRFIAFLLLLFVCVPFVFGLLVSSPVTDNLSSGKGVIRDLMLPLLIFRFTIYAAIIIFYKKVTRHFARKLEFAERDTEYALTKRDVMVYWIIGFEIVVTASLLIMLV